MAFNYTIWCFCIVNKQRPSDILVRSIMVVSKGFRKKRAQDGIMALFWGLRKMRAQKNVFHGAR